jgi:protein transport protein SEC61 subunit gamma-like protein
MKLKDTFRNYRRVLQVARKPGKDEFLNTSKISALGIGLIGVIGFIIFILFIFSGI